MHSMRRTAVVRGTTLGRGASPNRGRCGTVSCGPPRAIGATGFEPATFRPPAGTQIVSMRPLASRTSHASTVLDDLDVLDVVVGTTLVPRSQDCVSYVFVRIGGFAALDAANRPARG